jgi:hypothetical protein
VRGSSWRVATLLALAGCRAGGCSAPSPEATPDAAPIEDADAPDQPPDDAARESAGGDVDATPDAPPDAPVARRCPRDMVDIAGRFCIDRYEATLVDDGSGQGLSPNYPPEPGVPQRMFDLWEKKRGTVGPMSARQMLLPGIPEVELGAFAPRAVVRASVPPQGYVSGVVAAAACGRARKRLCTRDEWVTACRGEKGTRHPYGEGYRAGVCNVHRSGHPASILHDNPSIGHSDPRLDLVAADDGPLLRPTGAARGCASVWGQDAAYDMVGNVDEWIDDPEGTFVGGFFSRLTVNGCDAAVETHPLAYWDYSTGVRCCR